MWFCHNRPEDVDLFYLPYGLRQDRIARWLTGTVSGQRAATAAQKIATRGEIGGSGWSIGCLNLDANEKTLIAVRSPKDHSGVDIIAERAPEYVPANENSDTRVPAITTQKRTVRSPLLGADAVWTRIRDWARLGSAR